MIVNIIVAYCKNNGIGYNNTLPWYIKSDLKKFKNLTSVNKSAVLMGKNTYFSIKKYNVNGLVNRDNLILSTSLDIDNNIDNNIVKSFNNIEELELFIKNKHYDNLWIIGGEKIYNLFMNNYNNTLLKPHNLYITYIDKEFDCDSFFPKIDLSKYKFISQEIHNTNSEIYNYNIFNILYKNKYIQ